MSVRQTLQSDPETLQHLELAADARLEEARALLASGHTTASVYLAGYAAEMTLKTATFRVEGARPGDLVGPHLGPARARARKLIGDIDDENFHSILFWALLLRATRKHKGQPLTPQLAREVLGRSQHVHERWNVTMRYRANLCGLIDARSVLENVGWLRARADEFWR